MIAEKESVSKLVSSMLHNEMSRDEIETQLLEQGYEAAFVKELVAESVKMRDLKRRTQGLALILSGAVICFFSFLFTITSSYTHSSFPYVLFGLTSVGIVVVFAGLMKVF